MKKNNNGFSLVEMLVAVTILSIVMLVVAGILSSMSKSFGNSQKEVQLQDSVQTTYSILSEVIKEAQIDKNGDLYGVETAVTYDGNYKIYSEEDPEVVVGALKKAYIVSENLTKKEDSKVTIITLKDGKLYMEEKKLYSKNASGTYSKIEYKSQDVCIPANLLADKITDFSIENKYIGDEKKKDAEKQLSFTVLSLEAKYGSRKASITQNVYLRNSGSAIESIISNGGGGSKNKLDGYKLDAIVEYKLSKSEYPINVVPDYGNFEITGRFVKEGEEDLVEVIPQKDFYTSPEISKSETMTSVGKKSYSFVFDNKKTTEAFKKIDDWNPFKIQIAFVNVNTTPVKKTASIGINTNISSANANSDIQVLYNEQRDNVCAQGSMEVEVPAGGIYKCKACGAVMTEADVIQNYNNSGQPGLLCTGVIQYSWGSLPCQNSWNGNMGNYDKTDVPGGTQNKQYTASGTGKLTIRNASKVTDEDGGTDYSNVTVLVYFDTPDTYFVTNGEGDEYIVGTTSVDTTGSGTVQYNTDGKYLAVKLDELKKCDANDNYCQYVLNYKWVSTNDLLKEKNTPTLATFSINTSN